MFENVLVSCRCKSKWQTTTRISSPGSETFAYVRLINKMKNLKNFCLIFSSNVLPKKTNVRNGKRLLFRNTRCWGRPQSGSPFLLSTCRVEAVKSVGQCGLQDPQENRCILGLGARLQAEQLLADSSQQQAVEVLPVQQQIHVLQEESFTEPAELRSSVSLQMKNRRRLSLQVWRETIVMWLLFSECDH